MSDHDPGELLLIDNDTGIASGTPDLTESGSMRIYLHNDSQNLFPCLLLDPSLRIIWHNACYERTFPRAEHPGDSLFTLISGTIEEVKNEIAKSLRSPETGSSSGTKVPLKLSTNSHPDKGRIATGRFDWSAGLV